MKPILMAGGMLAMVKGHRLVLKDLSMEALQTSRQRSNEAVLLGNQIARHDCPE